MPIKTKNSETRSAKLLEIAQQAGLVLMTAAVTFGMLELPDRANSRIILPTQPAFGWANQSNEEINNNNTLRRASEETEQHYISYSVAQRTPARSGRS